MYNTGIMTAEASSFAPEVVIPEQLTHETFNELLSTTREFHFGAREGELYGRFHVDTHTDDRTVMVAEGHRRLTLSGARIVIEDTRSQGVLLRSIQTTPAYEGTMMLQEKAILLNSFAEQPKILQTDTPAFALRSADRLVKNILADGMPLDEKTALTLIGNIHELQADRQLARRGRVASLLQRLKPTSW